MPCCIASLSEAESRLFAARYGREMNTFHAGNLARVYPPGVNIDSRNFDPMPHWISGTQLVALNYQSSDYAMVVNEGYFREQNVGKVTY